MALEADRVDGYAVGDEGLYDAVERIRLGVDALDAVVVYTGRVSDDEMFLRVE